MKATIRDVAEAAGVSAMAVSAVLNGTRGNVKVSPERAELIRRVAQELRYQPNHLARSLRSRSTRMVAVVFQHLDRFGDEHPYYPQLLNGVMESLFPANYTLALCPKMMQGDASAAFSDGRFDGVLWCRPDFDEISVDAIRQSSVPVVMMHAPAGSVPGVPTYCADNDGAMATVIKHLRGLGHERIAFVIDTVNEHTAEGRARRYAFEQAALSVGLEPRTWIVNDPLVDIPRAAEPADAATALACFSDTLAGRVLLACDRAGISVPEDLSVVGFDSSPFCDRTRPRLTSVSQPVERMAKMATDTLLTLIRARAESAKEPAGNTVSFIYDCGLDIRESTAPPSARRRVTP